MLRLMSARHAAAIDSKAGSRSNARGVCLSYGDGGGNGARCDGWGIGGGLRGTHVFLNSTCA